MSISPYFIEGPAVVSFSGGRTSAYMLRKILDEGLQPDVHVVFADTGKERPETIDFIDRCEREWGFELVRVMRDGGFDALIHKRKYLPNPVTRFCTGDLKVKEIESYMRGLGYDFWSMVIGLRADEPRRVSGKRNAANRWWDYEMPLADSGVTEDDVMSFWESQPFDLNLRQHEGNCDLCFLKGKRKLLEILIDRPDLADWWIEMEQTTGSTFRKEWSYSELLAQADNMRRQTSFDFDVSVEHVSKRLVAQPPASTGEAVQELLSLESDDSRPCFCGD